MQPLKGPNGALHSFSNSPIEPYIALLKGYIQPYIAFERAPTMTWVEHRPGGYRQAVTRRCPATRLGRLPATSAHEVTTGELGCILATGYTGPSKGYVRLHGGSLKGYMQHYTGPFQGLYTHVGLFRLHKAIS